MAKTIALAQTQPDTPIAIGDLFDALGSLAIQVGKLHEKVDRLTSATTTLTNQVSVLTEAVRKGHHGGPPQDTIER